MDSNSLSAGYVAAFAVSGSVVLLALQVHKRILSNFMKQMEFEIGCGKREQKKKVRFADGDEITKMKKMTSSRKKAAGGVVQEAAMKMKMKKKKRNDHKHRCIPEEKLEEMPRNWQAMYKGILQNRALNSLPFR